MTQNAQNEIKMMTLEEMGEALNGRWIWHWGVRQTWRIDDARVAGDRLELWSICDEYPVAALTAEEARGLLAGGYAELLTPGPQGTTIQLKEYQR